MCQKYRSLIGIKFGIKFATLRPRRRRRLSEQLAQRHDTPEWLRGIQLKSLDRSGPCVEMNELKLAKCIVYNLR